MTSLTLTPGRPIVAEATARTVSYFKANSAVVKAVLHARSYWRSDMEPYSSN